MSLKGKIGLGGGKEEFPPGDYTAQVTNVKVVVRPDLRNPNEKVQRLEWSVDVWDHNQESWVPRKIWTGLNFTVVTPETESQFIGGLNKLTRACGFEVPQTIDEVEAFDPEDLIGRQFCWAVERDRESGKLTRLIVPFDDVPEPEPVAQPAPPPPPQRPAPTPRAQAPQQRAAAAQQRAGPAPQRAAAAPARPAPQRQPAAAAGVASGRNSAGAPAPAADEYDPFADQN